MKTNALIRCAANAQLMFVFVFAYANKKNNNNKDIFLMTWLICHRHSTQPAQIETRVSLSVKRQGEGEIMAREKSGNSKFRQVNLNIWICSCCFTSTVNICCHVRTVIYPNHTVPLLATRSQFTSVHYFDIN